MTKGSQMNSEYGALAIAALLAGRERQSEREKEGDRVADGPELSVL